MGFFQDLKEDLSQAVNELLPNENEVLEKEKLKAEESEGKVQEDELERTEVTDDIETTEENDLLSEDETDEISELDSLLNAMEEQDSNELLEENTSEVLEEPVVEKSLEEALADELAAMDVNEEESEVNNYVNNKGVKFMDDQNLGTKTIADETAIITAGMTINGDISSRGSLEVVGNIVGNIEILGKLNVTGSIQGNSKASEIFADSAKIVGEVHSEGSVKIGQSSVIIGNIIATSAVIAGAIKGDIDVKGPVVLDSSAIVMGNIMSKSVQINNGAVIEGLCSQCYAEVNPTAFFDDFKKTTKK